MNLFKEFKTTDLNREQDIIMISSQPVLTSISWLSFITDHPQVPGAFTGRRIFEYTSKKDADKEFDQPLTFIKAGVRDITYKEIGLSTRTAGLPDHLIFIQNNCFTILDMFIRLNGRTKAGRLTKSTQNLYRDFELDTKRFVKSRPTLKGFMVVLLNGPMNKKSTFWVSEFDWNCLIALANSQDDINKLCK
jgi:hypothetical protein